MVVRTPNLFHNPSLLLLLIVVISKPCQRSHLEQQHNNSPHCGKGQGFQKSPFAACHCVLVTAFLFQSCAEGQLSGTCLCSLLLPPESIPSPQCLSVPGEAAEPLAEVGDAVNNAGIWKLESSKLVFLWPKGCMGRSKKRTHDLEGCSGFWKPTAVRLSACNAQGIAAVPQKRGWEGTRSLQLCFASQGAPGSGLPFCHKLWWGNGAGEGMQADQSSQERQTHVGVAH